MSNTQTIDLIDKLAISTGKILKRSVTRNEKVVCNM